jgi:hypothetical protein
VQSRIAAETLHAEKFHFFEMPSCGGNLVKTGYRSDSMCSVSNLARDTLEDRRPSPGRTLSADSGIDLWGLLFPSVDFNGKGNPVRPQA